MDSHKISLTKLRRGRPRLRLDEKEKEDQNGQVKKS